MSGRRYNQDYQGDYGYGSGRGNPYQGDLGQCQRQERGYEGGAQGGQYEDLNNGQSYSPRPREDGGQKGYGGHEASYDRGYERQEHQTKPAGRVVQNTGVNKHGNEYKAYNDGAYAYKNYKEDGATRGNYFHTGHGHAFYKNKDPKYNFHENQNQGFRRYKE